MADKELKRGLESRHIQMIALGGTIGVGLFMGSASTIQWTGPSVLLAYAICGMFIFFIMRAMGEMLYMEPSTGSFATFGHKYIHPLAGYMVKVEQLVSICNRRDVRNYSGRSIYALLVPSFTSLGAWYDSHVDLRRGKLNFSQIIWRV